jgi:uncharacterized protein
VPPPLGSAWLRVDPALRFLVVARRRRASARIEVLLDGTSTLVNVVESVGIPRTEVGALKVGATAVPPGYVPSSEDVVDVLPVQRPQPGLPDRYVLDVHLGTLARRMRLLGLDTRYSREATDQQLLDQARATGRVLLTRDRGLLRRRALPAGALVRGDRPDDQLADVLDRFAPALAPWTRCPACNGLLEPVEREQVAALLQQGTLRTYNEFARCGDCGRPYWRGAHSPALEAIVARATGTSAR